MRRLFVLLAAGLSMAAPLAVSASPAHALDCVAPTVVLTEVGPTSLTVSPSEAEGFGVYVDIRSDGCTVSRVHARLTSPGGSASEFDLEDAGGDGDLSYFAGGLEVDPAALLNTDAGTWSAQIITESDGSPVTTVASLKVLRASTLTLEALPDRVTKGRTLTVGGALARASWQPAAYGGYPQQDVQLQFRPKGGTYKKVTTVVSRSRGVLKTTVAAAKDGCYRLVFGGSATTAKVTSRQECVDVR